MSGRGLAVVRKDQLYLAACGATCWYIRPKTKKKCVSDYLTVPN